MQTILIIVTFLAGNSWGPQVTTQSFSNKESCATTMHAVADNILGAAKSNITGQVVIENDNAGGLKIISGVNKRVMSIIKCS